MSRVQLTVYIPQGKEREKYPERLVNLAAKKERSVSFLLLAAIDRYLAAEEKRA